MSETSKFAAAAKAIWKDPVWSKVIAVGIVGALAAIWTTAKGQWGNLGGFLWGLLVTLWSWLGSTSLIWNWVLLLGGALLAVAVVMLLLLLRKHLRDESELPPPTIREYTTDTFEGLNWHWSYDTFDRILRIFPCCPVCELQLEPQAGYAAYGAVRLRTTYACEVCRQERASFEEDERTLMTRIQRLIQQKIRTGAWMEVVRARRDKLLQQLRA